MRKTTRLELVILSFILTFVLSNRLVARVFGSPTKSIVTLDATNENYLNKEASAFVLNNEIPLFHKISKNKVDFNLNIIAKNPKSSSISIAANVINVSCANETNGSIDLTVSGGTGNYSYSWTNSSGYNSIDEDIYNLADGDYTVTLLDEGIPAGSKTYTILKPDALDGIVTQTEITCNGTDDGTITVSGATGGYGTYEYSKDNGSTWQSSNTFSNLAPGTFQVLIRDAANVNCTKVLNPDLRITQKPVLTATVTQTEITCNGADDGTITVSGATGGYGTYEFSVDNGSTWQATGTFINLAPITYQVLMRDATNVNCKKVLNPDLRITQKPVLNASYSSTPITCFGANDGEIVFNSPSGGYGTYQYSINNGASWENNGVYNNLSNGTYKLLIRDKVKTNCVQEIENNLSLTQPEVLIADVTPTNITCNSAEDGMITLSNPSGGSGSYSYSINNGSTWQSSNTFSNLSPNTYSVFIRDANATNCKISLGNIEITEPFELNADVDFKNVGCNGANDGTITITNATGGYGTFEYSIDNGTTWKNSGHFESLTNNTYNVKIRDLAYPACLKTLNSALTISQPVVLTSSLTSSTNVKCTGETTGEVKVNAVGGTSPYTYNWGPLGSGAIKSNLIAGTYTMTAIDANGCEAEPLTVIISEPAAFLEITEITTTAGCNGQNNATATIEVEGGTGTYTYLWDATQAGITATGLAHGNHTVVVTDSNGCTKQETFSIAAPEPLVITDVTTTETTFYGSASGTATVSLSGGTPNYTFLWSDGQTGQVASNLVAGNYTVTVTDANGCSTAPKNVIIYDTIEAEISTSAVCLNTMDVIRTSYFEAKNTRGGNGTYSYSWNFGTNAINPNRTGAGKHTVTYNQTGEKTITLTITSGSQSITKTFTHFVVTCYSQCVAQDLQVEDFYIGDQAGNRLSLTNCQSNPNPPGASIWVEFNWNASRYSLYHEYLFVVNHPDGSNTVYENVFCSEDLSTPIPTHVKITDITYNCGDSVTLEKIYITVNQQTGLPCNGGAIPKCYSISVAANVSTPFYAVATASELLCNGSSDGAITIIATGGEKPYTYNIDGGIYQSSNTFNNLTAKSYVLKVKDADNKIFTLTSEVTEPSNPITITVSSQTPITCYSGSDGNITVTASGGTPNNSGNPYTYVWNNGQTTATASNLKAGDHEVTAIDANGCQVQRTITLVNPLEILADAGPDQIVNCGNSSTYLEAVYANENDELGIWTVVNGPDSGSFELDTEPNSLFTGTIGTYTLRWTVPCGEYDDMKITLSNCSTLDFDGLDDHIDFGDNFNPPENFALEAWVKQDNSAGTGVKSIISKRDSSNPIDGFELILNNNTPSFKWNNSTITSSHPIGTDRWYHIAVIQDDFTKLYVDGILVATGAVSVPISNVHKFIIGGVYNSTTPYIPTNFFKGWIEEVRIWNKSLTEEQLHFMMNQRLVNNAGKVRGVELPLDVPDGLTWDSLEAYYQMERVANGFTLGEASSGIEGKLMNISTSQERTAPLPYISNKSSSWFSDATWLRPNVWDPPSSTGINGDTITWNIARISHNINSGGKDIELLGLVSESNKLTIADPNGNLDENNAGQALTITHYLELNGTIDLVGESQLIQSEGSILASTSVGYIERDQQGTASSYNYNYWSSPVVTKGANNNSDYTISGIMMDGTNSAIPKNLDFGNGVTYADGAFSNPRKISTYWLYKFHGEADEYSDWEHIGSSGILNAGEGYTMKGTSGNADLETEQNYTFKGKPNNGDITLRIEEQQNFLIGNPYPSAIDADQFLLDNLSSSGGNNEVNVFNGALYFWDHFGGKTHTLREYVGGYATYNLLGGLKAISIDDRINTTSTDVSTKTPGRYIPVGQGFFINTILDDELSKFASVSGGEVIFKNSQRVFVQELKDVSVFHSQENTEKSSNKEEDTREKIRISFKSPKGYQRQLLVGADPNTTNGFDLGYDAPMNEYNAEDMFWIIGYNEFVIQGVANFNPEQILPIGIVVEEKGEIVIQLDSVQNIDDKKNIYLKDKWNNVIHDLRKEKFTSTSEAGYFLDRFELVFFKENESIQEEEEEEEEEVLKPNGALEIIPLEDPKLGVSEITIRYAHLRNEIQILNPNEEIIDDFRLYKMDGGLLQSFGTLPNSKEIILPVKNYSSGVYIAKCFLKNKIISQKFIRIK